uniref:Histidine kinase-, DNA gyrase B-, and HSP90-like ATPase family protein n=1 Tax=Rhizobium rhizogenes TaxID=359 RepID=A0A7S4ZUN8_RHIRH|nr:hypothetical protein [Rhizobium rhizogenes]QCO89403.1 histidine kinase-, DNA gyrase B-, and HSP90-like ATPase family protein [Rhizobium rhizogenes]
MNLLLPLELGWDPLEAASDSDHEILTAGKKREIKNILKSYVGTYDPMSELLQNAMDSVERRAAEGEEGYQPKIFVKIDLQENSFQVVDNGVGFKREQFMAFIAPSISFKAGGTTRGNKGVGATYIAYGFNNLQMRTKNPGFSFSGQFLGGRDWVEDGQGSVHRPKIEPIASEDEVFDSFDQGASFKIKFGGKHTRPSDLSWYNANTPEQWLYLLLLKTPLGHVNLPDQTPSAISFDLHVTTKDADNTASSCVAKYKFPHEEIAVSPRLRTVRALQTAALEKGRDPIKSTERYRNSNGVYDAFSGEEIVARFKTLSQADVDLIKQYNVSVYGYFAYSTSIWDTLNDKKAKLRKGFRVLRGGLQMANNHMAQGDLITIPLTKNTGHQNQAHVVVHFDNAEPDLGRKGFQPELKELGERLSALMVTYLSAARDLLKNDTGAEADIGKEIKVHDWMRDQEEHEKTHPLILTNQNFFLPMRRISMQSTPLCEQDSIVLFNQLIAGGVIRGIKLLSTSQVSQYDGMFRYVAEEPLENLKFDKVANPLGVYEEQLSQTYVGPPRILEYKFSLDGLIREFENGEKSEKDISLAVFWDIGTEFKREYNVTSLLDFDNIHHRRHHGITHVIRSANTQFDAVCLRELIEVLNDPDGQQAVQKERYGDEL